MTVGGPSPLVCPSPYAAHVMSSQTLRRLPGEQTVCVDEHQGLVVSSAASRASATFDTSILKPKLCV
jgi:hypothetical protein